MAILIKGMWLPKEGMIGIIINNEGKAFEATKTYDVVELSPHGRLIDADALRRLYDPKDYKLDGEETEEFEKCHVTMPVIRQNIDDMPTIIEAEGTGIKNGTCPLVEIPSQLNAIHGFRVIDKKTGKEADPYEIALKEEWAQHLMYCDMDGFAILEDGSLILCDECGQFNYAPADRFEVEICNGDD